MNNLPEDIVIACELLLEHYGSDYITDWSILQELLFQEFDVVIPVETLQAIKLDSISYLDISTNLNSCGINY